MLKNVVAQIAKLKLLHLHVHLNFLPFQIVEFKLLYQVILLIKLLYLFFHYLEVKYIF